MGRLDNKVAFVSGAARGMGQSHCRVFAAEGAKVVVARHPRRRGRRRGRRHRTERGVPASGRDQRGRVGCGHGRGDGDLRAVGRTGQQRRDRLSSSPLAELTLESYRRVTEVNQTGVFLGMRAAIGPMTESGGRVDHQHLLHRTG